MRFFVLLCVVLIGTSCPANADQLLKRVGDWLIMKPNKQEDSPQHCYVVSKPFRTKGYFKLENREPRFLISYTGKQQYTIMVNTDYDSDPEKGAILTVGQTSRQLEPVLGGSISRTYSSAQDIALVNDLIQAGEFFTIRTEDVNGNHILDYYSLRGFGKAMRIMTGSCNYK